jgi:hypothetical protein
MLVKCSAVLRTECCGTLVCTEISDDPGLIRVALVSRLSSHVYTYFYTAKDKGTSGSCALSTTLAVAVRCVSLCAAQKGAGADKSSSERRERRGPQRAHH